MSLAALLRHALPICLLLIAAASRAAPTLVGTGTQASSSATTSVTLAAPAGLAAGDLMLAILVARTASLPLDQQLSSVPSGWTLVRSADDGSAMGLAIYRKLATAAEPASYGWTLASGARVAAALQAFRGVDAATPVEASSAQSNAASSTYTAPSVTTSTANALVVSFHAATNGNESVANPSGMTQAVNLATGAGPNGVVLGSSYVTQAAAGASGNKLSTGNASLTHLGALVALRSGPAVTLTSGTRYSFESYDVPGSYIRHRNYLGYIDPVSASSNSLTRNDSTFIARPGLTNSACWSFESVNLPGYYLRHNNFVLKLNTYSATPPYPADATFCLRSGLADATAISFEASNYAGYYLQHKVDTSMILATTDGTAAVNGRATFYPRTGWAPTVDHYELSAPSAGLACQASTLTVTACADSSSPCTNPATNLSGQTAALATTAGTLGSGTVTFDSSGTAATTLGYAAASAGSTATVTLSGESTLATSARRCCADGTSCSAANSCSTTFNTAGFLIAASTGGSAATVPTQTAGMSSGNWVLRAVKTNTTTQACEAALSGATTVNWGVQCNDPTTCSSGNRMTLTGASAVAVAGNANGSSGAGTAVTMSFDANGNAPFSFNYADVGKVTLLVSKAAGGSLLAPLSGSSNSFVVKPAGLVLSAIRCASYAAGACATSAIASPGNNPGAASASGSAFMPAGGPFSATVTAVDASGNATPNYGRETAPEGVTLAAALVLPAGGNAPALSNASAFGSFSGGAATGTTFAWPEVGIVTLTPAVADGSYLGAGNVTGTASGNVGRFVPASFALSAASTTHRGVAACSPASTFTYLDENFSLGFTLTARNVAGTTTQNYTGSFAKLDPTVATGWNLAGISGTTIFSTASGRLTLGSASGAWSGGTAAVTLNAAALRAAAPDGPFNAAFGIAPVDSDGVGMLTLNLDTDSPANVADRALLGQVLLRYGRLRLQNALGAAYRGLRLPLTAQYWDSATASFKTNDLDSCTRITAANLSFGNFRKALTSADAVMSPSTVTVDPLTPVFITLAAPSGGRVGSMDIAIALGSNTTDASCLKTASGWTPSVAATAGANLGAMRGAWCGSAASSDPSARATWGLYRGADGVIYQRENY